MPSFVNPEKCTGCGPQTESDCQHICPNNLMVVNKEAGKAYNREPDQCWECQSCVKTCPNQAITIRGYADFIPMGAGVVPVRSAKSIAWTVTFRNGNIKQFSFPTRTTIEGTAAPDGGFSRRPFLEPQTLFTEPDSLGTASVWTGSETRRDA